MTNLMASIETLRKELILLAEEKGLDHADTIECSQLLDQLVLLVQYEQKTKSTSSNEEMEMASAHY